MGYEKLGHKIKIRLNLIRAQEEIKIQPENTSQQERGQREFENSKTNKLGRSALTLWGHRKTEERKKGLKHTIHNGGIGH